MLAPNLSTRWIQRLAIASLLGVQSTCGLATAFAQDQSIESAAAATQLGSQLDPWLSALQLKTPQFTLSGIGSIPIDDKTQQVEVQLVRHSDSDFELVLKHPEYALTLVRTEDLTAVVLPKHRKVFWGQGSVDSEDHLDSKELLKRTIKATTQIAVPFELIKFLDGPAAAELLMASNQIKPVAQVPSSAQPVANSTLWQISHNAQVTLNQAGTPSELSIATLVINDLRATLVLSNEHKAIFPRPEGQSPRDWVQSHWGDYDIEPIAREEIEKTIARGMRRATEILAPSSRLTEPIQKNRKIKHGELRWIDGQRVALLYGTPEEIGKAHGQLLKTEAMRCIDSVLYGFGFAQTIANGRWFRKDLDGAYAQLKAHIPQRHLVETRAMAKSLGLDEQLVEALNVFPELFHCSGFALMGNATADGKLYHGRVLDYMTAIGLQDAATTFIVAPEGQIPFANIGYAGFIGSVSGMNAEKISLGEMGGRGEGQWNGVPMATLMRRAMEECDSLDEVKTLWSQSPRTCEYYYVFADGQEKSAVGVAATPEKIDFVEPGMSHELLGEGIPNAVVLSEGSRLQKLRNRIEQHYGKIDTAQAMELMCRPVAMESNLHNVLFVPEDGLLYVANASHSKPAAEMPYAKLDLGALLQEIEKQYPPKTTAKSAATLNQRVFEAKDSLAMQIAKEASQDAKQCLDGLCWEPRTFEVRIDQADDKQKRSGIDQIVRFPSPVSSGDPINDSVAMEWYRASKKGQELPQAPAVVVVHESGRGMTVGKMIARGLSNQGVHALLLQLPSYGLRRNPASSRGEGETLIAGLKQGIADARRAYDAVSALPGIDPQRISIQGTSLGGFVVATTTGLDAVYHRSMILLAGGDLYGVLANGDRDAAKTRQELAKSGISMEQAKEALYAIEPLRLAHRAAADRTWLFSGTHDTVVPPVSSKKFADAAKLPEGHHIELPADHYSGVVFLPSVIQQMAALACQDPNASEPKPDAQ
ncbi:MAG: C45 family autoproteolytic acyltransferase/hydrolase [Planctomycetota bacterium]|nr:C45 family autoproteolytic acyltransferase/hydrolase [Planctomycetota bacterium]